ARDKEKKEKLKEPARNTRYNIPCHRRDNDQQSD
ncbi:hypothetical protein PAT3040_01754, partial [Paenibacillus agaridevorans]